MSCGELPAGFAPLLRPQATVVLGDLTGTREVPDLVGRIACHAAAAGMPVRLVLEVPRSEGERIDAYLRSRGDVDDRIALLRGPFWLHSTGASATRAMLALLEAEKAVVVDEVAAVAAKVETVATEAAQLQAQAKDDPRLVKAAAAKTAQAQHLGEELQRKRDRVDALSTRVGDAPLEILQMRAARRIQPPKTELSKDASNVIVPGAP